MRAATRFIKAVGGDRVPRVGVVWQTSLGPRGARAELARPWERLVPRCLHLRVLRAAAVVLRHPPRFDHEMRPLSGFAFFFARCDTEARKRNCVPLATTTNVASTADATALVDKKTLAKKKKKKGGQR